MMLVTRFFIEQPAIAVAVITATSALLGALITALVTRRKDSATMALEIAKEARADVVALRERLATVEEKLGIESESHAKTKRKLHLLEEKYSAAIAFIISLLTLWEGLKTRLKRIGFEHGEPPSLPELVAEDYYKAIQKD
jgi:hypothetical protein